MSALNRAYGTSEERTFWLRRFLSIVLIISLGLSLVFLFNLIVFSEQVDIWLERPWALSMQAPSLAGLLRHTTGVLAHWWRQPSSTGWRPICACAGLTSCRDLSCFLPSGH